MLYLFKNYIPPVEKIYNKNIKFILFNKLYLFAVGVFYSKNYEYFDNDAPPENSEQ